MNKPTVKANKIIKLPDDKVKNAKEDIRKIEDKLNERNSNENKLNGQNLNENKLN